MLPAVVIMPGNYMASFEMQFMIFILVGFYQIECLGILDLHNFNRLTDLATQLHLP